MEEEDILHPLINSHVSFNEFVHEGKMLFRDCCSIFSLDGLKISFEFFFFLR